MLHFTIFFALFICGTYSYCLDFLAPIRESLSPFVHSGINEDVLNRLEQIGSGGAAFGLQIINNELFILSETYNVLKRLAPWHAHEVIIYILALENVLEHHKYTIPDVEFVIAVNDPVSPPPLDGSPKLPLLRYCTCKESFDIPIPSFHFYSEHQLYTTLIRPHIKYEWAEKIAVAYASYTMYGRAYNEKLPSTQRLWHGVEVAESTKMIRTLLKDWALNHSANVPPIRIVQNEFKEMSEWGKNKYIIHVDGISCSNKFEESLATGSLVFKEESGFVAFFHSLIKPFVHYVPWFKTAPDDLFDGLDWAAQNEKASQRIAMNGRVFVEKYLHPNMVRCYWSLLFREYAKLQRFNVSERHATTRVPSSVFLREIKANRSELWKDIFIW